MGKQHKGYLATFLTVVLALVTACEQGTSTQGASQPGRQPQSAPAADAVTDAAAPAQRPVVAETLPYAEVEEQLFYGHFAFPADMVDPLPGIIVLHERWGLDDGTRALSDRLAAQGYIVLAVDLFGGKTATDGAGASALMVPVIENPELANENIRQAYEFLAESGQAPRSGAIGWSFGGNWALNTALLYPDDLDAAIIYYGQVSDNEERLAPMNVPVLGLFGENDKGVTVETVTAFETVLEKLGKDYRIEVYSGVGHAFADPTSQNYNEEIANLAWTEVLAFLGEHLDEAAE
jgi:carboxymethylenebutenolidase